MTLTDEQLRDEIAKGKKLAEIAREYGVTRQAVGQRVKKLTFTETVLATVSKAESREFVNSQVDALSEMMRSLSRVTLLQDACDEWLRSADDPEKYDIGPRAGEINVTYYDVTSDGKTIAKTATLQSLIARVEGADRQHRNENAQYFETGRVEFKYADPRETILKTAQETRQTVAQMVDLARLLADARAMQTFREAMLAEIAKVSPEIAQRIAEAVRSVLILHQSTE